MRWTRAAHTLAAMGLLGVIAGLPLRAEPLAGQKRVLVVYPTTHDSPLTRLADRELSRVLDEGVPGGVDLFAEFIDLNRFADPEYPLRYREFLREKYKGRPFDLVIAIEDFALRFVESSRDALFPGVPIVYGVVGPLDHPIANATGVVAPIDFRGTIELARTLQPGVREVFVVGGAAARDRLYEELARSQFRGLEPALAFTYLSGLPGAELERRLAALPDNAIVFYLLVSKDAAGVTVRSIEHLTRISKLANRPTYAWLDSMMDHGIVGGSLLHPETTFDAIGEAGVRVLRGAAAGSLPVSTIQSARPLVDWRQMERWRMTGASLPAGTRVLFREPAVWTRYTRDIVGAVALVLLQVALVGSLLMQAGKRRRAEARLRASQVELRNSYARLLRAEDGERSRIGRELHDDIGQRLAALTMALDGLGHGAPLGPVEWQRRVAELSGRTVDLSKDIQLISRELHSSSLEYLGLVPACAAMCRELSSGLPIGIDFSTRDVPEDVSKDVAFCMFRVLQEALNNALAHARASRVQVLLWAEGGELRLDVADDGVGFDTEAAAAGPGLGLLSLAERLGILGGRLSVESRPGVGSSLHAILPLARASGTSAGAAA